MDRDGSVTGDGQTAELAALDGDGSAGTRRAILTSAHHVAIFTIRHATSSERRLPGAIAIVDDHVSSRSSSESDLIVISLHPFGQGRASADLVRKANHPDDARPTVLALPRASRTIATARTVIAVGSTLIAIVKAVSREDGRGAVVVCQGKDVGQEELIVRRLVREVTAALAIVVDDENVGLV